MRAIVKEWDGDEFIASVGFYDNGAPYVLDWDSKGFISILTGNALEIISEDEWDAEIYALLLIESGVIYE